MSDAVLPVFWVLVGGIGAAYIGLFVAARRPVSLRLGRLGGIAVVAVMARGVLYLCGWKLALGPEAVLAAVLLAMAAGCGLANRVWLVRSTADGLRRQMETGCEGLFLKLEESPGGYSLTARGRTAHLGCRRLTTGLQVMVLPRPNGTGKVALLAQWLSKQYPGPIPRMRIVLTRSEP